MSTEIKTAPVPIIIGISLVIESNDENPGASTAI